MNRGNDDECVTERVKRLTLESPEMCYRACQTFDSRFWKAQKCVTERVKRLTAAFGKARNVFVLNMVLLLFRTGVALSGFEIRSYVVRKQMSRHLVFWF